jgi:hypothetical protein
MVRDNRKLYYTIPILIISKLSPLARLPRLNLSLRVVMSLKVKRMPKMLIMLILKELTFKLGVKRCSNLRI